MKNTIICCILILGLSTGAHASNLLDFDSFNARLYGTAEALVSEPGEINNLENAPASLDGIQGNEFTSGFIRWTGLLNIYKFAYARPFGRFGTAGLALSYATLEDITDYDVNGIEQGTLKNSDLLVSAAYAREIISGLSAGITLKYLSMVLSEDLSGGWMGAGLSALYEAPLPDDANRIRASAGIQNINLIQAKVVSQSSGYPQSLFLSGTYSRIFTDKFSADAGMVMRFQTLGRFYLSLGAEVKILDLAFLRFGGYLLKRDLDGIALGAGIKKSISGLLFKFDYGLSLNKWTPSHFIQLGMSFGK